MIFADDFFLLSASRNGLQAMVDICQEFVASRNLKFGTHVNPDKSKTKYIVFAKRMKPNFKPANIMLNGDRLPWVKQVKHLGHTSVGQQHENGCGPEERGLHRKD